MSNRSLSDEEIVVICTAIDLFIPNKLPGVDNFKKHEVNSFAQNAKEKIMLRKSDFSIREIHAICCSLLFFQVAISETDDCCTVDLEFKNDSEKYFAIIEDLLTRFEPYMSSTGI